jgi:hypothetical protein
MTDERRSVCDVPWERLDPPMVPLVRALNQTGYVRTTGCCVGHVDGAPASILFEVTDRRRWRRLNVRLLKLSGADFTVTVYQRYFLKPDHQLACDWEIQVFAPSQDAVLKALPVITKAVT